MFAKALQAFKIREVRNKILIVLLILVVFRVLAAIPISGINIVRLQELLNENQLLGFLNLFSGGGLSGLSIAMLGVGPYITATIIMQLLTMVFPSIKAMYSEEGAQGRAKFNRYSRYLTVPLAALQGYGFLQLLGGHGVLPRLGFMGTMENVALVTAGSMIVMWLGELITEQKVGNGISIIIFAGIVAGLPQFFQRLWVSYTPDLLITYIALALLTIVITAGIVLLSEGERKIPITYAKRVRGNKIYGGATSYLPLKVNQAGMIPIIFSISVLLFPQFFAQIITLFAPDLGANLTNWTNAFLSNQGLYIVIYFFLTVVFTFFYTAITFNPEEVSKNLQQSGGFVPGIRPGEKTTNFLQTTIGRITFFGALFLGLIAVIPNLLQIFTNAQSLTIGSVALLIVVAVVIDIVRQINAQMLMREYE